MRTPIAAAAAIALALTLGGTFAATIAVGAEPDPLQTSTPSTPATEQSTSDPTANPTEQPTAPAESPTPTETPTPTPTETAPPTPSPTPTETSSPSDPYGLPNVDLAFNPAAVVITATPTGMGKVVWIDFFAVEAADSGYGSTTVLEGTCPPAGPNICEFTGLHSGVWNVHAYQDVGDGVSEAYGAVESYFYVPPTPVIVSLTNNGDGTATLAGTSVPGDRVHIVGDGVSVSCTTEAIVDATGAWSCTSEVLTIAAHFFRAYTEDLTSDTTHGGLSALGDPQLLTTSKSSPPPVHHGPKLTTLTPNWSFDLSGISLDQVHPGDHFTVSGSGLPGGALLTVELHSTPVDLAETTISPVGEFSVSGTIPLDAELGVHHLVLTLTGDGLEPTTNERVITIIAPTVAPVAVVKPKPAAVPPPVGDSTTSPTAPNILTHGLETIGDVLTHPAKIGGAISLGLVLLIFAIFPAHLLNATFAENYERFTRRIPRLRSEPKWYQAVKTWFAKVPFLGGLTITTVTALLFGFADPKFGFTLASLRLVLAGAIALFVVVYLANALAGLIVRRQWAVDVAVRIRPLGILLTLVGVILSRTLDFSPGFLIGLVLGLTMSGKPAATHAWKAVIIRAGIVIGLAATAWLSFSALSPGFGEHATFENELFMETLVAITTEGTVVLLVELLPFHLLEGQRLFRHSRALWATIYLTVLVIFIVAVVPWEGNWEALGASVWSWVTVVAIFDIVCVGTYVYFRYFAKGFHSEHELEEEEELDDERVGAKIDF